MKGAKGSEHRGDIVDHWATQITAEGDEPGSWEPRGWQKIHGDLKPLVGEIGASLNAEDTANDHRPASNKKHTIGKGAGNVEEWLGASSEALSATPAAPAPPLMRVRLDYAKIGRARFISHLEMIDVFSSAMRRAGIPIAFSGGFSTASMLPSHARLAPAFRLAQKAIAKYSTST